MKVLEHGVVFSSPETYAGWPANHGAWSWENEHLVGFLAGPYDASKRMHHVGRPFGFYMSRSLDNGKTWNSYRVPHEFRVGSTFLLVPGACPEDSIFRVCGRYDHGADCSKSGGYYRSADRGRTWQGPFPMNGVWDTARYTNTSRTCVLGDLWGITAGETGAFATDRTFIGKYEAGRFNYVGEVGAGQVGRRVMPSLARVGNSWYCALRRRHNDECWVELYKSPDHGQSWSSIDTGFKTGSRNGNPPALSSSESGKLVLVIGDRDSGSLNFRCYDADGSYLSSGTLRSGVYCHNDYNDFGYPQLLKTGQNEFLAVYYWANKETPIQHIATTRFVCE